MKSHFKTTKDKKMFCKHFNFFESVHTKFKTWNRGCMEYLECSTYKYSRRQQQQLVYMLECPEDRRLFFLSLSLQENSTSTKGTSQNVPQNINFKQQQLPFLKKEKNIENKFITLFLPSFSSYFKKTSSHRFWKKWEPCC